ncbi:hypothetical protein AGMMS4952_01180 [Spirochaetia bacterium]|nr:hypothetical protein AGMMS4952_01180 [Spirochaetia bacterium]
MTPVKEKTVELIKRLPDKQKAYQNLLKYKGSLPVDFDYEKELAEAKVRR